MTANEEIIESLETGRQDLADAYNAHLTEADELMERIPDQLIPTVLAAKDRVIKERDQVLEAFDLLIADAKK